MAGSGYHLAAAQETLASLIPSEMEMSRILPRHLDPDSASLTAQQHIQHQDSQTERLNAETLNQQPGRPNEQQSEDFKVAAPVPSVVVTSNIGDNRGSAPEFETLSCEF